LDAFHVGTILLFWETGFGFGLFVVSAIDGRQHFSGLKSGVELSEKPEHVGFPNATFFAAMGELVKKLVAASVFIMRTRLVHRFGGFQEE
jgi:hypothetical protein